MRTSCPESLNPTNNALDTTNFVISTVAASNTLLYGYVPSGDLLNCVNVVDEI
jgi:hypothetical protein